MTTEPKKQKPTPEMMAFKSEYLQNSNEEYAEKTRLEKELKMLKSQTSKAIIGFGVGLKIAADNLEEIEKDLKQCAIRSYPNVMVEFNREFKADYNDFDWTAR